MHELSIAMNLVEAACEQLPRLGKNARICALHLRVGALSGVVSSALRFSFDAAAAGSPIAGAALRIEDVPLSVWCDRCDAAMPDVSVQLLQCPRCGGPTPRVLTGRELELAAVEVIDADADR